MKTRKRKNIIAVINIILFAFILFIGILLTTSGDYVLGWILILLSILIILFSVMSLLKRRKDEDNI